MLSSLINTRQDQIITDFSLFEDWMGKYQYLIDLGKKLPEFSEQWKTDEFKIQGCQSQVWLHLEYIENKLSLRATSDSAIVSGLVYLLWYVYNGCTKSEIINTEPYFIAEIGLDKYLSPTRKNGLNELLKNIKKSAMIYSVL